MIQSVVEKARNGSVWRSMAALNVLKQAIARRHILFATTAVELRKKYSGSVLGPLWIVLLPTLLLSVYVFIYLVVFPTKQPQFSGAHFVVYVFCGLVPYMGLLEVIGTGALAVKQNIHLVKNIMMPIELIPIRSVMIGMVSQLVSLAFLLILLVIVGALSWNVLWLPVILVLQFLMMLGVVYVLSAITVSLPDVNYFIGLLLTLGMFISPIGYNPASLSPILRLVLIKFNPAAYMIEGFRDCLLAGRVPDVPMNLIFAGLSVASFIVGAAFFERFKSILVDYE